jgi:uncharacterized membrane protein YfcA
MLSAEIYILLASLLAGLVGALLGIGGGMIVVPVLTLVVGVDIRYAVAASLVAVVATSCGAAARNLENGLAHFRLATVLEVATVTGALCGVYFFTRISSHSLYLLFGIVLYLIVGLAFFKRSSSGEVSNHPWSARLGIGTGVDHPVAALPVGFMVMFFAGIFSAMLGIGSGIFKVLALDTAMKLPFKISTATSTLMMGVTATAAACAYFVKGDMRMEIAAPVAMGVLIGSRAGSRLLPHVPAQVLRILFAVVVLGVGTQMLLRGLHG